MRGKGSARDVMMHAEKYTEARSAIATLIMRGKKTGSGDEGRSD